MVGEPEIQCTISYPHSISCTIIQLFSLQSSIARIWLLTTTGLSFPSIAVQYIEHCVVICLKNRTFAVSQTTCPPAGASSAALWFAWKIVLLQYRKQLGRPSRLRSSCCDLLEKSYFCSIANNVACVPYPSLWVVICLKNRTFAVSQTTRKLFYCC